MTAVVTTRNSAETLEACLDSLRAQSYPDIEVVVVDNASTDATLAIARRLADVVLDQGPERSAQRNAGAAAGSGQFLLIVDSDMTLTPLVVEQCVRQSRETGATAVIVPERTIGATFLARAKALERDCYIGDELIEAPRFFAREAYERYGGYDEEMTGGEDWDLPARMRKKEQFGRIEAAIIHDEGALRLGPLLRKKFYYGRGVYRYGRRHPERVLRQATPFRRAFLRNWKSLRREPLLAAAMLGMKVAEIGAGGVGALAEAASTKGSRRR